MAESDLKTLLETTNLPVAYHHFISPPKSPYIVYLLNDSENFGADDKVFVKSNNYFVELYSDLKDPASELLLENLFDANDIFYDKFETWIESEKLYLVSYEITY